MNKEIALKLFKMFDKVDEIERTANICRLYADFIREYPEMTELVKEHCDASWVSWPRVLEYSQDEEL